MPPRAKDLLALPQKADKGDFVIKLTESLQAPKETVHDYVVTPSLRQSFEDSLNLIDAALRANSSKAAYLHGSFGSGKSHFMAMLGLMLDDDPQAWSVPRLQPLKAQHDWLGKKKLLRVAVHMLGQKSLRDAVFAAYLDAVRVDHPDAPVPPLFADAALFDNADELCATIGEEKFFETLNAGLETGDDEGWGDLEGTDTWDRARFDEVRGAKDPQLRQALFQRLVATFFKSFTAGEDYIDFDSGLEVLSKHAHGLGYDGVLMLLDEFILWLSGRLNEGSLVAQEIDYAVKLVEAQHSNRPIPIISFIARQRSLVELAGSQSVGAETKSLYERLDHNQGRFSIVELEQRNLPAIVQQRLLKPLDDSAAAQIGQAFADFRSRASSPEFQALLGGQGDVDGFQKVYPLSPSLLEALVGISDSFQRERTALKMLSDLLLEHIEDLEVGDIVPLGDLFDIVMVGDLVLDSKLRQRFRRAQEVYEDKLLPVIRQLNDTEDAAKCQRLRDDHRVMLGCANCPQQKCRADNRLVKTLLMADLVPNCRVFDNLTVRRLVALNHGCVTTVIPGQQGKIAAQRLREIQVEVSALRLGDEDDPTVRIAVDAMDLDPILMAAGSRDTEGARKALLKELLYEAMGFPGEREEVLERTVQWKGTTRRGQVLFANVRELGDQRLRPSGGCDWLLVVDYPFDQAGHGPLEDEQKVEKWRDNNHDGATTIVWLPSFFSADLQQRLGQLVTVKAVLRPTEKDKYLADLREDDRIRAEQALENRESQLRGGLRMALEKAYGLASVQDGEKDLDPDRRIQNHFACLLPDQLFQGLTATNFEQAFLQLVHELLHRRFPRHPSLGDKKVTTGRLQKVLAAVRELREHGDRSVPMQSRADRSELQDIAIPLALVEGTRAGVRLNERFASDLEKIRRQEGSDLPTVGKVREWLDPDGKRGLPREVDDLLILCYAELTDRELRDLAGAQEGVMGKLYDHVQLHQQPLPSAEQWTGALDRAKAVFGYVSTKHGLTTSNVREFVENLRASINKHQGAVAELPGLLQKRLSELGAPAEGDRLGTASELAGLVRMVGEETPTVVIERLAAHAFAAEPAALGRALATVDSQHRGLSNDFQYRMIGGQPELRSQLVELLGRGEIAAELEGGIEKLAQNVPTQKQPPKGPTGTGWKQVIAVRAEEGSTADVQRRLDEVARIVKEGGDDAKWRIELTVERREEGGS